MEDVNLNLEWGQKEGQVYEWEQGLTQKDIQRIKKIVCPPIMLSYGVQLVVEVMGLGGIRESNDPGSLLDQWRTQEPEGEGRKEGELGREHVPCGDSEHGQDDASEETVQPGSPLQHWREGTGEDFGDTCLLPNSDKEELELFIEEIEKKVYEEMGQLEPDEARAWFGKRTKREIESVMDFVYKSTEEEER